jgi:hypothetical protein
MQNAPLRRYLRDASLLAVKTGLGLISGKTRRGTGQRLQLLLNFFSFRSQLPYLSFMPYSHLPG